MFVGAAIGLAIVAFAAAALPHLVPGVRGFEEETRQLSSEELQELHSSTEQTVEEICGLPMRTSATDGEDSDDDGAGWSGFSLRNVVRMFRCLRSQHRLIAVELENARRMRQRSMDVYRSSALVRSQKPLQEEMRRRRHDREGLITAPGDRDAVAAEEAIVFRKREGNITERQPAAEPTKTYRKTAPNVIELEPE
jgi:hypothetical protein